MLVDESCAAERPARRPVARGFLLNTGRACNWLICGGTGGQAATGSFVGALTVRLQLAHLWGHWRSGCGLGHYGSMTVASLGRTGLRERLLWVIVQ
jgi:hypothetical protein